MTEQDQNLAQLRYLDGTYEVLRSGQYVRCAVSGQAIALDALCYWSVERQEAYATAEIALGVWKKYHAT